jgi:circadian clock protein KaiC
LTIKREKKTKAPSLKAGFQKVPSGIRGLDEITNGGLPKGRTTLITGGAGCGKTMFGMEFLFCGALKYGDPGVFVSFEENPEELTENVSSMGKNVKALVDRKLLLLEYIRVDKSEIEETGEYDLDGLFIRLGHAIDQIKAKRIVLDTLETLFSGLTNTLIIRAELRRLFRWLKTKGITAILTGERSASEVSKYSLEEFVADCVITLDHRITEQISTRRLRIVKYRGSMHGTNEYPFLIDSTGISVLPVTSLGLIHGAPTERVSTGSKGLDAMLGGSGYFRGSSVLISGTAGTGKTSFAALFAAAACRAKKKCLYYAFEESPDQIIRNMRSIGIVLKPYVADGTLNIHASRPTLFGLEQHLVAMSNQIEEFAPDIVIVDPMSNLVTVGTPLDVKNMLTRLIDTLKIRKVTTLFTTLVSEGVDFLNLSEIGISSLMDTWIMLRSVETQGEADRLLHIKKSRGMKHSSRVRGFTMTDDGIVFHELSAGNGKQRDDQDHGVKYGNGRDGVGARRLKGAGYAGQEAKKGR